MYNDFQIISQDDEWYEGLEFDNEEELDMADAVKIQDPISSLTLDAPLVVECGTSLKNALNLLQEEKKNCLLVVDNDKLKGIITERDILLSGCFLTRTAGFGGAGLCRTRALCLGRGLILMSQCPS